MGGKGSGRSKAATDAVEAILAATAKGDATAITKCAQKIDVARRHGTSRMTGARVSQLMRKLCADLNLNVQDAVANPVEHLGDVRISLVDGSKVWIEVKGQTKKEKFADFTQADYVRDGTDFLRAYVKSTPTLDRQIAGNLRLELGLDIPLTFTSTWGLGDLWMADLALLETEAKKSRAGVRTPRQLAKFLKEKYLVHLSMEGVRFLRIVELRPVMAYYSGEPVQIVLDTSSKAKVAAIRVSAGIKPTVNTTDFTYHIGYKKVHAPGRHKLHNIALSKSPHLKVIK